MRLTVIVIIWIMALKYHFKSKLIISVFIFWPSGIVIFGIMPFKHVLRISYRVESFYNEINLTYQNEANRHCYYLG